MPSPPVGVCFGWQGCTHSCVMMVQVSVAKIVLHQTRRMVMPPCRHPVQSSFCVVFTLEPVGSIVK